MKNAGTFNPAMVVHGTQAVTLHREVPVDGKATLTSSIVAMYDKEKAGIIVTETQAVSDGEPLYTLRSAIFIRGEGGFGGERGPSGPQNVPPSGPPTTRSATRRCRPRRCSTACPATAIRCTPIPASPPSPGSIGRSCTDCARTASPAGPCSTPCAAPTPPASGTSRGVSRRRCSPATR